MIKTCSYGHQFNRTSACLVCPICDQEKKKRTSLFTHLSAPARRALEREGVDSLSALSKISEKELLELHGMGKSSIPKLKLLLAEAGLSFRA